MSISHETIELEWTPENDGHQTVVAFVRNTGTVPLKIKSVSSSCSCVLPSICKPNLQPGDETELSLDIHVAQYGVQEVFVTLETDSEITPSEILLVNLSGAPTTVPQLWQPAPTTLLKFQEPGQELTSEIEIVTLEDASESPWITGLDSDAEANIEHAKWELLHFKDESGGSKGAVVRTYTYNISVTPIQFERTIVNLTVATKSIPVQRIPSIQIVMEPAPVIRAIPSKLEIHRNITGTSEARLILIADDGQPLELRDKNDGEWCQFRCDNDLRDFPPNTRRITVTFDWNLFTEDFGDQYILTVKTNHMAMEEVRIPVIFKN